MVVCPGNLKINIKKIIAFHPWFVTLVGISHIIEIVAAEKLKII